MMHLFVGMLLGILGKFRSSDRSILQMTMVSSRIILPNLFVNSVKSSMVMHWISTSNSERISISEIRLLCVR